MYLTILYAFCQYNLDKHILIWYLGLIYSRFLYNLPTRLPCFNKKWSNLSELQLQKQASNSPPHSQGWSLMSNFLIIPFWFTILFLFTSLNGRNSRHEILIRKITFSSNIYIFISANVSIAQFRSGAHPHTITSPSLLGIWQSV